MLLVQFESELLRVDKKHDALVALGVLLGLRHGTEAFLLQGEVRDVLLALERDLLHRPHALRLPTSTRRYTCSYRWKPSE